MWLLWSQTFHSYFISHISILAIEAVSRPCWLTYHINCSASYDFLWSRPPQWGILTAQWTGRNTHWTTTDMISLLCDSSALLRRQKHTLHWKLFGIVPNGQIRPGPMKRPSTQFHCTQYSAILWETSTSHLWLDKQCPYWSNEFPTSICVREGAGNQLRLSVCGRRTQGVRACFMLTSAPASLRLINMRAWGQQPGQPHLPMIGNFRLTPAFPTIPTLLTLASPTIPTLLVPNTGIKYISNGNYHWC